MIRKIFILSLFFLLVLLKTYSENFYLDTSDFINYSDSEWLTVRILTNNQYGILKGHKKDSEILSGLRIERECVSIHLETHDHFLRDKYSYLNHGKKKYRYYVPGKGVIMEIIVTPEDIVPIWIPYEMWENANDIASFSLKKWKQFKEIEQYDAIDMELQMNCVKIYDSGIKNIFASSCMSENTRKGRVTYSANNILEKIYYRPGQDYDFIQYDSITPPWVEGKDDYGIGEYLDIEFKWLSDELQILNGFVDFTRMDLYEKNSRVKTVLIESESPKFLEEYQLEDLVKYTVINLPQKTDKIRMTIKDVYPGTKYRDTCLSSILVTNPNVPNYEEMKENILNALIDGYDKSSHYEAMALQRFIRDVSEK
ncbi:hypothetical protein [Treponema sp. Marseille-Q3903]|uniref:NADase-type glycan-binding domain-containing protein n=1 Tax=Treponema sp. Marseille-Q3903 TaxID=2766703 RepID=UPI001651B838|nr:hypothetical protein [Treponema sp. Marseille-Q3903]MBC6714033.1 hypothetical protein [Treponema sp. Marseille-Q3903]